MFEKKLGRPVFLCIMGPQMSATNPDRTIYYWKKPYPRIKGPNMALCQASVYQYPFYAIYFSRKELLVLYLSTFPR